MSRLRTVLAAAVVAVAGSLAWASGAAATTFCVPAFFAGCPNSGGNVAQANLETAATTNASDGIKDTIRIQPGHTYTDTESFVPTGSDDLDVIGGGTSTVLTSSSTANVYIVRLDDRAGLVRVSNLTIKAPASFPNSGGNGAAMQIKNDVVDNVRLISDNPNTAGITSIIGGATLTDLSFPDTGSGSFADAIRSGSNTTSTVNISGAVIRGVTNGISNSGPSAEYVISDSYIEPDATIGQTAVSLSDGTASIRNSVIVTSKGVPFSLFAFTGTSPFLGVDGVTMYDTNPTPTAPFTVQSTTTGTASAVITGSIARGFTGAYVRGATGSGPSSIVIAYSNTPATGTSAGPGSGTIVNAVNADPLFTNPAAGDFTLKPASPSIDAADPDSTLTTDFIGNPRPLDGDADFSDVADQGAFEYQPPPDGTDPDTTIDSGPGKKGKKGKPKFSFSSDEQAIFECSVVKKGRPAKFSPCTSPQSYKLKRKKRPVTYTFSVRAVDLADNVDKSPAQKSFKVKKKP